jgi:exopolysaccharide production protein ExoY
MANASVARRGERKIPGESWSTTEALRRTDTRGQRSSDRRLIESNHPNIVWLYAAPTVVGGVIKRGFDIFGAAAAIVVLLPLAAVIALAIKAWDRGPVFYRHRRIGLNGAAFDCLKFRTMVLNSDEALQRHLAANSAAAQEWKESQKLKNDPRVTSLGRTLRKTSVDELPQLLNILKGEMSFVGPRPIVAAEVPKYGECIAHYLRARPGLTGPWQVSGRSDTGYDTRVTLDRHYVEHWSFGRDLALIVSTVRVVVTARGSY